MIDTGKLINEIVKWGTLGLLGLIVAAGASGQMIGWLGGVPKSELREAVAQATGAPLPEDASVREMLAQLASSSAAPAAPLPSGLVIASTLRCADLAPRGAWATFDPAIGRMIVGAGDVSATPYKTGISRKVAWTPNAAEGEAAVVGGAEEVTLTVPQMPSHDHGGQTGNDTGASILYNERDDFILRFDAGGEPDVNTSNKLRHTHTIPAQGGGAPHPNMPPYLALHFCEKL